MYAKSFKTEDIDGMIAALKELPDAFVTRFKSSGETLTEKFKDENVSAELAHRVEQGGIGFSSTDAMATENLANCMGVIVRDPATGRTALAHYDDTSTLESLNRIFDGMPKGRALDVVLLGAKYGPESVGNDYARNSSIKNLSDVLTFLAGRDVRILAARIHDPQQPTAFSVDPKTFAINVSTDISGNSLEDYAMARKFLGNGGRQPMAVEFDFDKSPKRNLYHLGEEQVSNLENRVRGKDFDEIAAWYREKGAHGGFENVMAKLAVKYLDAFDKGAAFTTTDEPLSSFESGGTIHHSGVAYNR